MTDATLIARLEAATGADYALNEAIALATGWTCARKRSRARHGLWLAPGTCPGEDGYFKDPPAFTASIDAALTLVPEGAGLKLLRYWIASVEGAVWHAEICTGGTPEKPRQVFEHWDAPTPALAICIAALRARSEGEGV